MTDLIDVFLAADDAACEAEAVALGQAGKSELPTLKTLLATEAVDVRFWAVRGLWANASPAAVDLLIDALRDEQEMVRSGAAFALGVLRAEAAVAALAELLTGDPSPSGGHAADALSKIGRAATPALIDALTHDQALVRVRAAKSLLPIEDRTAIGPLFHALADDSYLVRHYAELALERMGVGQMVYFT